MVEAMAGIDHVYLFAANPDIAAAVEEPGIDFWQGTYLTHNVLEAARVNGVPRITYASGSGVYGDRGVQEVDEEFGPLVPVSTYGASKLGCEAMLAAYAHMFGIHTVVFRFANVVGARQTHGVTYDFVRRLLEDPRSCASRATDTRASPTSTSPTSSRRCSPCSTAGGRASRSSTPAPATT